MGLLLHEYNSITVIFLGIKYVIKNIKKLKIHIIINVSSLLFVIHYFKNAV